MFIIMPSYGRYNRRRRMVAVKPSSARKYTPRRKNYSKKPQISFAKKVNAVIARNVENKYSNTILYKEPVITQLQSMTSGAFGVVTTDPKKFFTWSPGNSANGMTTISQGTAVNQRVGNKIKIKRWIIKGIIQPNNSMSNAPPTGSVTANWSDGKLLNTLCGYVDIYFGKYNLNVAPVDAELTKFYQSGATDYTPTGLTTEQLYNVNRDLYKIYYHKRFKMGANSTAHAGTSPNENAAQSNGFNLTRSFGFDVCKYVLKNHILKFDEAINVALDPNMENLTMWAIFHPAAGNVGLTAISPIFSPYPATTSLQSSFYEINCMSYFEYEDA